MSVARARHEAIEKLRRLPQQVEELVAGLAAEDLTTQTLAGEWTIAQNIHHLADSHINSYVRCKLMATEENPTLKPYDEAAWAELPDGSSLHHLTYSHEFATIELPLVFMCIQTSSISVSDSILGGKQCKTGNGNYR